ncbi:MULTISPECIES: hypothetical protein [unclassified Acidovorax]|uniref:hypothetical protein n=1 Tax=unclassified Acidovorax TaxID=2684926 RepID=UPI001C450B0A|nr:MULTISPECIES: hypothetical protein [unclassified Acidovorax]MBV7431013.1 hypothetical protein [Acidovorax sp. sif0732]MBV7452119.1 hypothetical protein [Acidovorax sp. sif0715]
MTTAHCQGTELPAVGATPNASLPSGEPISISVYDLVPPAAHTTARAAVLMVAGEVHADPNVICIEDELVNYIRALATNVPESKIQVVLAWYGLRGSQRLTLEEIGAEMGYTRARAAQVLDSTFRDRIVDKPLPILRQVAHLMHAQHCIRGDEFLQLLASHGIVWRSSNSLQGLLVLLHEAGLSKEMGLYTSQFDPPPRSTSEPASLFFVRQEESQVLKACLREAADLPGLLGIANLRELAKRSHWSAMCERAVRSAIKVSAVTWFCEQGDDFWYMFENRSNRLLGFFSKVFSVIDAADISQLAPVLANAFRARSHDYNYPSTSLIQAYMRDSVQLKREGNTVTLVRGQDQARSPLTDIERDIVEFLSKVPQTSYPALKQFLLGKGYGDAAINKSTMNSPLVLVDKSAGRQNYVYRLVPAAPALPMNPQALRYEQYLGRLRSLLEEGTDEENQGSRRKEQSILQDWLFSGKKTECCAMCGRLFSIHSLVTAHKKRRADCVPAERLDPHIVMPLCTFGCDFLYERGYVYFDGFEMVANTDLAAATADWAAGQALAGRLLHESFRSGGPGYLRGKPSPT